MIALCSVSSSSHIFTIFSNQYSHGMKNVLFIKFNSKAVSRCSILPLKLWCWLLKLLKSMGVLRVGFNPKIVNFLLQNTVKPSNCSLNFNQKYKKNPCQQIINDFYRIQAYLLTAFWVRIIKIAFFRTLCSCAFYTLSRATIQRTLVHFA